MNKSHEERDRLAKERFPWPHFCVVHPDVLARRNDFKAGFDAATEIHQHILAEKEKRIEKLRKALRFYAVASHYIESIETDETGVIFEGIKVAKDCGDIARAALQEDGK